MFSIYKHKFYSRFSELITDNIISFLLLNFFPKCSYPYNILEIHAPLNSLIGINHWFSEDLKTLCSSRNGYLHPRNDRKKNKFMVVRETLQRIENILFYIHMKIISREVVLSAMNEINETKLNY